MAEWPQCNPLARASLSAEEKKSCSQEQRRVGQTRQPEPALGQPCGPSRSETAVTTQDLADNAALQLLARLSMLLVAPAFAVVGWLMVRSVETVDTISTKLDTLTERVIETNAALRLVQQSQSAQAQVLVDHEARMRALERSAAFPPP